MDEAATHVAPLLDIALTDDDHIRRDSEAPERATEPHRLHGRVLDLGLHHEEVQVAARASVATSVRAEQHDACAWRRLRKPASRLDDGRVIDHAGHASRSLPGPPPTQHSSQRPPPYGLHDDRIRAVGVEVHTAMDQLHVDCAAPAAG